MGQYIPNWTYHFFQVIQLKCIPLAFLLWSVLCQLLRSEVWEPRCIIQEAKQARISGILLPLKKMRKEWVMYDFFFKENVLDL